MSINQININQGSQEQAVAGNAGIILASLEKELGTVAFDPAQHLKKIKLDQLDTSLKMISQACAIKPVVKYQQEKDQAGNQPEERSGQKNKKAGQKAQSSQALIRYYKAAAPKTLLLDQSELRGLVDLELLKQYFTLLVKALDNSGLNEALVELEKKLGLSAATLNKLKERMLQLILKEFAYLLRSRLENHLTSAESIFNFILKHQEATRFIIADNITFATANIKDITKIAAELGFYFDEQTLLALADKIKRENSGSIVFDNSLETDKRVKQLLLDEYKLVEVALMLENSPWKKGRLFIQRWRVQQILREANLDEFRIQATTLEAQKIAWAKCVAILKNLHLKRVFSSSLKDFGQYSLQIKHYTLKSRQLGPNWLGTRLEKLALEAASYKLELLHSMQTLEYNKEREKDIKSLTTTTKHYKKICNG